MQVISSVGDFLNVVNELYPKNGDAFFRGQSSSEFNVSSSLCRLINKLNQGVKEDANNFSRILFEKFEENLPAYPESAFLKNYVTNEVDILMTAQHYGMPTRLIDWTTNPLISLYFASDEKNDHEYMSVFILKNVENKPLKLISSSSLIKSMACDRKTMHQLYCCIERSCDRINKSNSIGSLTHSELSAIVYDCITKIESIPNNVALEYRARNFFKSYDGDGENFFELAKSISEKLRSWQASSLNEESYGYIANELLGILSMLADNIKNHLSGVSGMNLYGNSHIMVEPLPINSRIKNQQGVFLFSKKCDAPEFYKESFVHRENHIKEFSDINNSIKASPIVRIDINRKFSEKIKTELSRYGIKKSFIYPELSSFAEEKMTEMLSKYET